jgi:iron complex transport system ATP-binding protein
VTASLIAENLSVAAGRRALLDRLSLTLQPGSVIAVLGRNGVGKSSLMRVLAGLDAASQGRVHIGGDSVHALPGALRARRIGYLPQHPEIAWSVRVADYVGLGRLPHRGGRGASPDDRAAVEEALAETALLEFRDRDMLSLSGGERARAVLARALAGRPEWLIADEPFTGLDLSHQFDMGALLRRAAGEGRGVLVSLHDIGFAASLADRVVLLHDNGVAADGPPRSVLTAEVLGAAFAVETAWLKGQGGPVLEVLAKRP